jgi:DNA polymerase I-like protein with 3'-5' exonuclease and polymerase domains
VKRLLALDIETACGVNLCEGKCEHALDEHRNRVTVVGVYSVGDDGRPDGRVFRSLELLRQYLDGIPGGYSLVTHGGKFDFKTLCAHGLDLTEHWEHDTQLMGSVSLEKVSTEYLEWYAGERTRINKTLRRGFSHRPGSPLSLKVLAPYFLGVSPFWENPENHDNDEYVLKDCEYTYRLAQEFLRRLQSEGSLEFYRGKLFQWALLLLAAERRGITLDMDALAKAEVEADAKAREAKRILDELWAPAYRAFYDVARAELVDSYNEKRTAALEKLKPPSVDKMRKCSARYQALFTRAAEKLPKEVNLDSPAQLTWLLRDYLKLDIQDFDGEETTGKAVLQKLASTGREDIKAFIAYRKNRKLSTAFFPSYRDMQVDGVIHCSFNPTGPRTGRLSSSRPNLQQVEKGIHHLFRARPGHKLATFDESAIEPRLIAYYTADLNLYDIVSTGKDFHNYNTAIFFDLDHATPQFKAKYARERDVGKEVALALMYGAGVNRLMESAQKRGFVWSLKEARYKLDRFKEFYEGVYRFREEVINPALHAGPVTNLFGRPFTIEDPTNVHMQGLNTLIQGSASDLVLNSAHRMTTEFRARGIHAQVLLLVHDEIVTEIPAQNEAKCVEIITRCMTDYKLETYLGPVPLAVEGKVSDVWEK